MGIANIEVSAYEGTPGHYRFDRLNRVIGFVCGRLASSGVQKPGEVVAESISKIHDHKGTLEVHWSSALAAFKYGHFFIEAWSEVGGEGSLDFHLPNERTIELNCPS